ncbi:DNA-binding protein [Lysobacter sp. D1-1-M9]|uniref:DNA-binding protein n=1 Tax=Novilysobacter longmucuonensis TaxID=3098603 RepID=UPI002FC87C7A
MPAIQIEEFVESVREPGTPNLSPKRIAAALGLGWEDLAEVARVHPNTLRLHPESSRVQASMRDILRVASALFEIQPDRDRTTTLKDTPIREFGGRSLLDMIREDRVDDAVTYLRSISSGHVG